jgi:hypothetical protein
MRLRSLEMRSRFQQKTQVHQDLIHDRIRHALGEASVPRGEIERAGLIAADESGRPQSVTVERNCDAAASRRRPW